VKQVGFHFSAGSERVVDGERGESTQEEDVIGGVRKK